MSSTHVEGVHPSIAEFGRTVGENEEGEGSSAANSQAITKIRIIGPAVSKRVSRGLTRAVRRPSDYTNLHMERLDHHHQPLDASADMMIATTTAPHHHTKTAHQPPTPETDDDDDDLDEFDSGTAFSPLLCETPIPPLPRARIPSRLGAVSAHPYEPHELGEPLTQGMILIGRPASTASYNRMSVPLEDRRRGESGLADTPSTSILPDGRDMSGRITSLEQDLKPLLLCQSMGIKIETKSADFVPGTIAQIVFHCPRCLKHWKISGKPKPPSDCQEPHQPTRGPEYNISTQSHRIMQELEKLPEYGKQQLIEVLSRTGSPGVEEELLELVNSASSGFLQESSTSPHASRRSRSPEKRSMIRLSTERNSSSPVEKFRQVAGLHEEQRSRSANRKSERIKLRKGATSAGVKSSIRDARAINTPHHQTKEQTTVTLEEHGGQEDNLNKKVDEELTFGKEEEISSSVREASGEHTKVDEGLHTLGNDQLTTNLQPSNDLNEQIPSKPPGHKRIPRGEASATGHLIVEFEDIDGTTYHGFMSPTGNFVPIASVDCTGNRLPIAMKPDGSICIISRYGSQALDLSSDDTKETQETSGSVIEVKDTSGAIVRGYTNLSGQFVPVARTDDAGLEHAVMMKTDGKFYVQSHSNDNDDEVVLSDLHLEESDGSSAKHPAALSNGQTFPNRRTVQQQRAEITSITELESHDGFKYQGFDSSGFGFIPTARIDPDGSRRPVVMNAEGEYTVVNDDGRMIGVHLQCPSDDCRANSKCTGCRFLSQSQSQSRMLFNAMSSTSSNSSDGSLILSCPRHTPSRELDMDGTVQGNHLVKAGGTTPPSGRSSHKFRHMTYKREPDGSMYHGCCQSGNFVPVFRLDERGCRHPVLTDSEGKYYTIDKDGQSKYADKDVKGPTNSSPESRNKVATRELNGSTFEGRHTIDGRFVPMWYLDDLGNRKAVMQSRNGQYMFTGSNGHINFVKFPGTDNEVNLMSGFNPADKSNTTIRMGEDGLKYEGYTDNRGEFIPTVRIDKSGFRQMVLINSKDQGYVIGYDGEVELVPFTIPRKSTKRRTKRETFSHTPSERSLNSKGSQAASVEEGFLPGRALTQSSHIRITPRGSTNRTQDGDGDTSDKNENNGKTNVLSGNSLQVHGSESRMKDARSSSGKSLTSHYEDGTVIYREKSTHEPSTTDMYDISKMPSLTTHSEGYSPKPGESAENADNQGKEERKGASPSNDKNVKYPGTKDDSKRSSFKEAAERVVLDMKTTKEHRDTMGKPIVKNTAVRNVTGRPDTKAGQFRKHVMATPQEDLTNTLALGKMTSPSDSQDTAGINVGKPSEVSNVASTKLPNLQKNSGLPPLSSQGEWETILEGQDASSGQGSGSLPFSLPESGPLDRANALPPVERTRRKSKAEKTIQKKVGSENRRRASQAPAADFSPDPVAETNQANDAVTDQSQSPADLFSKYSKFKLTADPSLSPLPSPPVSSDKEQTYRMMYSTLPSHLRSSSSPPPSQSTPLTQTFSSEQSKSPEPILFQKESSTVQVSTLPIKCDQDIGPAPKVSSSILKKGLLQPSQSIYRSRTSLAINRSSNCLLGAKESFPDSISKIWQQHKREVEFLRQTFYLPLTNAFTFSVFDLPEQYEEHNSTMRQKAKQIRSMKKPTKLGKPTKIMQRRQDPPPLRKIARPLQTIPYRIKAKMARA